VVQVCNGSVRNGFAIVRPPGHHAESDQALGFCYFNNVAIAVKHCMQRQLAQRVAIVDWDVHHGNGTQEAFDSDPNVLYVSLHRHDNGLCDNVWRRMLSAGNFFPGTGAVTEIGAASARGSMVNVPFSGGAMGNAEYLLAWRLVVEPVLAEFAPDLIVVSAGFDAAVGHSDALGGYMLTPAIYAYFTQRLMRYAHGKLVLCLEGGYELSALTDSAEQCVAALCELPIASLEHTQTRFVCINRHPRMSSRAELTQPPWKRCKR
jgi:histone deacetylase 4/5